MYITPTQSMNIDSVRVTEDVMKDSMHKKMTVYFDPDYTMLYDKRTLAHIDHLATDIENGVYKFEVLNLDRQKSKTLTIQLKDQRS